ERSLVAGSLLVPSDVQGCIVALQGNCHCGPRIKSWIESGRRWPHDIWLSSYVMSQRVPTWLRQARAQDDQQSIQGGCSSKGVRGVQSSNSRKQCGEPREQHGLCIAVPWDSGRRRSALLGGAGLAVVPAGAVAVRADDAAARLGAVDGSGRARAVDRRTRRAPVRGAFALARSARGGVLPA